MKITLNNRDMCRLGSMYIHAVGTNPARETIIGPGSTQILDIFDGGESITLICVASIVEEVPEAEAAYAGEMRNKPSGVVESWFDRNLPEDQWPTHENLAKLGKARDTSGDSGDGLQAEDKRRGEQAIRRQEASQYPAEQSQGGVSSGAIAAQQARDKAAADAKAGKVNLTGK